MSNLINSLQNTFKTQYEIAILEMMDDGIIATYPELGGHFETISWDEWENKLRHVALPANRHSDGAEHVEYAKNYTQKYGIVTFAFLLPWSNK